MYRIIYLTSSFLENSKPTRENTRTGSIQTANAYSGRKRYMDSSLTLVLGRIVIPFAFFILSRNSSFKLKFSIISVYYIYNYDPVRRGNGYISARPIACSPPTPLPPPRGPRHDNALLHIRSLNHGNVP